MDHSSAVPSGTKALAIATLVINLILIQPTFLILWKHGKRGILGWMYLQVLCAIRIVANAIEIHDLANHKSSSTATVVLNGVGLSPLILAITGILHEARRIRNPELNDKLQWVIVLQYHLLVSGALGLIIYGIMQLTESHVTNTSSAVTKAGAGLLIVCYVLLVVWAVLSWRLQRHTRSPVYEMGSKLLYGILAALPFVAIRLGYGVASLILQLDHPLSTFLTSLPVKAALGLVPEVIVDLILIIAGLLTLSANRVFSHAKVTGSPSFVGEQ